MAKYELSLVKSYVQEWTAEDAIREIIQNAIDESNRERRQCEECRVWSRRKDFNNL